MLIVSFYSYKGGSGRSTTSWNTIQRLMQIDGLKPTIENPYVIVDTDVDSSGSTFLYEAEDDFSGEGRRKKSVQDRMEKSSLVYADAAESVRKEFFNGMLPIGHKFGLDPEENQSVLLIGANVDKKNTINEKQIVSAANRKEKRDILHDNITKACKACKAKALFFDTPSGTQFLADWSIRESDIIVCCMRPSRQFRTGTLVQLNDFIEDHVENRVDKIYILTPTAVCMDKEDQKFGEHQYPEKAFKDIRALFNGSRKPKEVSEEEYKKYVKLDMLEQADDGSMVTFGIPEVKRFKWQEDCLGRLEKLTENDKTALDRYDYLAKTIKKYYDLIK